ncbi:hypothetical protein F4819DRAFT_309216 [Hypoxylon fuscum]|nr:hypothetical protein F4819DRAFT_309216 [Hypoxylon fuscum]
MEETGRDVGEVSKGLISDNDDVAETPLSCGDSFCDIFAFEDIDIPLAEDESNPVVAEDAAAPMNSGSMNPGLFKLRPSLPDVNKIVGWIMGRDLVVEEDRQISNDTEAREVNLAERENLGGQPFISDDFFDIGDVQDICPACTTPYCQAIDSLPFKGSLKLNYNDPETHTWSIGDKYVMTEMVDQCPEEADVTLVLATECIRESTRVPIPDVVAGWKENGKVITIVERPLGHRLYDIWWNLSGDERERIAREVARHVDQWRRLKADRISSLGGGPVHHDSLFGTGREGFGPFLTNEEAWEAIYRRLQSKNIDDSIIQVLKDYMPESAPCVITHGDLSCANIMIYNGRVSAILGFDNAACLPVWAENVAAHFCYCREDEQWKAMLSRNMKRYDRAKDWWSLWNAVEDRSSNKKRIAALVARCRRWQKPAEKKESFVAGLADEEEGMQPEQPSSEHPISETGSQQQQQQPPVRDISQAQRIRSSFRMTLSKKLLQGRHYSELLIDPYWAEALVLQSERSPRMARVEEGVSTTWSQFQFPGGPPMGSEWGRLYSVEGIDSEEDEEDDKRLRIERWLSDSERGKNAFPRPLLLQQHTHQSAAREVPWRERQRQRSFERRDNNSKGLRPFSLAISEGAKQKLRDAGQEKNVDEDDGGRGNNDNSDDRQASLKKTLESLESGRDDPTTATAAPATSTRPGIEQARHSLPPTEKKRISIFRERTAPGWLYLAVANAAGRRQQRSRSEERVSMTEDQAAGQQRQRQRPLSLMPPAGKTLPEDPTAE